MKFSIKVFFSKYDQIRSFLRIWPHLLKKSLIDNFIFFGNGLADVNLFSIPLTENLKCFRLNPYGFNLVIIPLGIRWALMKYHTKPLDMAKTQGFRQDFITAEITWAFQRNDIEFKGILKNPTDI